jgi:hypothetical protein
VSSHACSLAPEVRFPNGDGTFQQPVTPAFLSSGFGGTYAAHVTGDGKPDILAVNAIPLTSFGQVANIPLAVTVFANQGSGNFKSLGTFTPRDRTILGVRNSCLAQRCRFE